MIGTSKIEVEFLTETKADKIERLLCENIIDTINFNPRHLNKEELIQSARASSDQCEEILKLFREINENK